MACCALPCRAGESEKKLNAPRVVRLLHQAGAAAVVVHGRTMEQRYKKAADWALLSDLVQANPGLPVIGNGDILTHYEAADRCGTYARMPRLLSELWCVSDRHMLTV